MKQLTIDLMKSSAKIEGRRITTIKQVKHFINSLPVGVTISMADDILIRKYKNLVFCKINGKKLKMYEK